MKRDPRIKLYEDIREFERVQFQSNLAYNNELIQPPKVNDYGT